MIPYGRQTIDESDIEAVTRVLKSDYLTTGPEVQKFEEEIAAYTGSKHAVVCNSGTAALHLAANACGVGPGDVVIVPSNTFIASASTIRFCGAEVEFCDVDPWTGNLSVESVERIAREVGKKLKAILPVHFAGQPVALEPLKKFGVVLMEDAAQGLGASYKNQKVGSCAHSKVTSFSFHPVKSITSGEGGAVTTNDRNLYEKMLRFRSHGLDREPTHWKNTVERDTEQARWYYEIHELGYNYRLPDILCALGRNQLKKLDAFVSARGKLVELYRKQIAEIFPDWVRPLEITPGAQSAHHLFVVRIPFSRLKITRSTVMSALREKGIQTQVNHIPLHRLNVFANRKQRELPGAEAYFQECLSLPLYPDLNAREISKILQVLKEALPLP